MTGLLTFAVLAVGYVLAYRAGKRAGSRTATPVTDALASSFDDAHHAELHEQVRMLGAVVVWHQTHGNNVTCHVCARPLHGTEHATLALEVGTDERRCVAYCTDCDPRNRS